MKLTFVCFLLSALGMVAWSGESPDTPAPGSTNSWSATVNGLQARITLVEAAKINGTRWLVPYLELRNARDLANPMEIRCDRENVQFELLDEAENVVTNWGMMNRSGPVPQIGVINLPLESSIRISMECRNWGVPKDAAAMVSTDSGAWVLKESDRGRKLLRVRITGEKIEGDHWKTWQGKLQTPAIKIEWKP
jgi:hypothetical protein